jgi:hypothetical protein
MSKGPTHWYLEKIQKERNIKLPSCLFNNVGLKKLDQVLNTKNPYLYSRFYKHFKEYIDLSPFWRLSEQIKLERNVTEEDKQLISELIKSTNKDPNSFFDMIGNLFHIANLVDEMNSSNLKRTIHISLMQFIFINMLEILTKYFADMVKNHILIKKENQKYNNFLKAFKNNEHPTLGSTIDTMVKLGILKNKKKTIFYKNKCIRNKIGHANMFYDSKRNTIYFTNGKEYPLTEFKNAFESLKDYLDEFLYQYNDKENNILSNIDGVFEKLSNSFLRISRSGELKRRFNQIVFEWEKED